MKIMGSVKEIFKNTGSNLRTGKLNDVYGVRRDDGMWATLTSENFKDIRPRVGSRVLIIVENTVVVYATVTKF